MMVIGVPSYERNFCGHSQITKADNIANWLRNVTQDLIEQGATTFYLGGYGEFDSLAASFYGNKEKVSANRAGSCIGIFEHWPGCFWL